MITIKYLNIKRSFKYLWLKKVENVDLDTHCAKSLIGEYVEDINIVHDHYNDVILSDGIYYLCGVAIPFNWEDNLHLAFRYSEGERVSINNDAYSIEIENAAIIAISKEHIDYNLRKAKFKTYNTCRNWWFANWFKKNIEV